MRQRNYGGGYPVYCRSNSCCFQPGGEAFYPPGTPWNMHQVESNAGKIKRVNILLNAIDAQGEASAINLEGVRQAGFVGFAVSDEGPGITPEAMPYIYDPFFTTKDKGTGLGLSVVHRILDQHGGRITILNRRERGVRVEILLPQQSPRS